MALTLVSVPQERGLALVKKTTLKSYQATAPDEAAQAAKAAPDSPLAASSAAKSVTALPTSEVTVGTADPESLVQLKLANSELYFRAVQRERQLERGETVESPPSGLEREQAAQLRVRDRLVKYLETRKKSN